MSAEYALQKAIFELLPDGWYLSLPGVSGNYASTPDSAANSITGDIDIRIKAAASDWTSGSNQALLLKYSVTGAYFFFINATTGFPRLSWDDSGGVPRTAESTVAVPFADGSSGWLRVTLDVDDGAGGHVVRFYTSTDYDPALGSGSWTQLGADRTGAFTTSIRDTADPLELGRGTIAGVGPFGGAIYHAELRNGIGGTVVAAFDPGDADPFASSVVSSQTGETWTVNTSGSDKAELVCADVLDHVPQANESEDPAAFPYVVIGDDTAAEFDTDDVNGQEHTITLHVWDRYRGRKRVKQLLDAIYDTLHDAALTVAGHNTIFCFWEFSGSVPDPDGLTQHAVTRFRIVTQEG